MLLLLEVNKMIDNLNQSCRACYQNKPERGSVQNTFSPYRALSVFLPSYNGYIHNTINRGYDHIQVSINQRPGVGISHFRFQLVFSVTLNWKLTFDDKQS